MNFSGETIWIIGASSGIGRALAVELAGLGATLALSARRADELETLNQQLGGAHGVYPLDVADVKAVHAVAAALPKLDRVIFLAATYKPADMEEMSDEFIKQMVEVNLLGAIYVAQATMPKLKETGGQLALCASVAGYVGMPSGQPYSATKAALINYAESLHAQAPANVDIKLINSGFVRTRITDKNDFHMPLRLEPEQAAKAIAKGLHSSVFEINFPKPFTCAMKIFRFMPYWIKLRVTRQMAKKLGY